MANKTLLAQIKQRSDTAANWTAKNPIISDGELIIVTTNAGEKRFKVGDGEKTFTQLPYADENILSKIKTYTAGNGISISDTGVISSTGGGSGSDIFVVETDDTGENITTSFDDIKNAIQNHRCLILYDNKGSESSSILIHGFYLNDATTTHDEYIALMYVIKGAYITFNLFQAPGSTTVEQAIEQFNIPNASWSNPPTSGAAYWNASNKEWEIKDIASTTYKAGNGISISNDGTISVTAAKIYSGTSNAPSADLGENGDIYIQTEG